MFRFYFPQTQKKKRKQKKKENKYETENNICKHLIQHLVCLHKVKIQHFRMHACVCVVRSLYAYLYVRFVSSQKGSQTIWSIHEYCAFPSNSLFGLTYCCDDGSALFPYVDARYYFLSYFFLKFLFYILLYVCFSLIIENNGRKRTVIEVHSFIQFVCS